MEEGRPEKQKIRSLWLSKLRAYRDAFPNDEVPLYLTLSGAEGHDIQMLISNGLIRLTEVGAIVAEDQGLAVAIESSSYAVLRLQRRMPGLKILEQSFDNLLHSTKLTTWPQGEHERFCQARIVNLDLNRPLKFDDVDGELVFPPIQWVKKLCILHAAARLDWCLLLTLHGEAVWESRETKAVAEFLNENFSREPVFAEAAASLLGESLFTHVSQLTIPAANRLSRVDQQHLLMLYVPKRIAHMALEYGWRTETANNLRYGGRSRHAPMVTWIIDFRWDGRISSRPEAIYRDSLRQILVGAGSIAEDGSIS